MQRFILATMIASLAGPALALSCMRPDAVRLYEQARDSEDLYSMVIGTVTPNAPIVAPTAQGRKTSETPVTLSGRSLTNAGFTGAFDQTVTLRLSCLSVWCADAPEFEDEVLVTLRHEQDNLVIDVSPCPANALPANADDEARILNCHRFEKCDAQQF